MKFGKLFIMNTIILAGCLLLTPAIASADPLGAHFSFIDSKSFKKADMNFAVSMECGTDLGNTSVNGKNFIVTFGDGKARHTDSGELGYTSAVYCPKPVAFKNNSDGTFNPNYRVIDAGSPALAKRLETIASIHGVTLAVKSECHEEDKICGTPTKIINSDGSTFTVISYLLRQVTVTFPGAPTKSLKDYFDESGITDFTGVVSKVNRSPSDNSPVTDAQQKNNPGPFFTADEILPDLFNRAKADATNN
jgi:hypothetical protein